VHHDELSARERAALFALLAAARKLSNSELEAQIGMRLEGKERRKLNDLKLVESEKPGREFVHELSDAGWRWCADELAGGSRLARAVCAYGAAFWGVRLSLQAVFDVKPHLTAWWLTAGNHTLTVLFACFTAVYAYAALR